MEYAQLIIQTISALAVVASLLYLTKQVRSASLIHKQNHEWNRRIETQHALNSYSRLEAVVSLNEAFEFSTRKHAIPINEINCKLKDDHALNIHLARLLNYYEGLANGVDMGLYEEIVIKEARRGAMINIFTNFREYIEYDRKESNPMVFVKYEALVNKWEKEGKQGINLNKLGEV